MQLDGVIPVFCLEDSKNPKGLKDGSEGHRLVEKTGPKDTVWLLLIGRLPPKVDREYLSGWVSVRSTGTAQNNRRKSK
jgi:hypothetical protein